MKHRNPNRRRVRGAFTLIELLLVMVIIAILAAIVVPKFTGQGEKARYHAAQQDISNIKTALGTFEVENGRYPTTEEGLQALVTNPGNLKDWSQGLEKVPMSPWGQAYIYRCPGSSGADYDLTFTDPKTGQEAPQ
jgi:general secretion pathway protein G